MSTTDPTQPERQKRYLEAQAKRGMVRVPVWIPEHKREFFLELARYWREACKK